MAEEELWLSLKLQIEDVQAKLNTITSQGKQSANTIGTSFNSLKPIMASVFGVGSVLALTAKVKQFAGESIRAFSDTEYSAMALDNTLKNMGVSKEGIASVEDMVDQLEKLTFFDDAEIREALSNAVIKLGDLDLAIKTIQVSTEVARAKNISLTDSVQRLSLGLLGNTRGLKELGINVKDFGEGAELTATEKLSILDAVLKKVEGSVASFSDTTKGKLEAQKTAWGNLKEAIGETFAELTRPATTGTTVLLDVITEKIKGMNEVREEQLRIERELMKTDIEEGNFWALLKQADLLKGFPAFSNYYGFQTLLEAIGLSAKDFNKEIEDATTGWNDMGTGVKNVDKEVEGLEKGVEDVGEVIEEAFEPLWKPITLMGGNLPELSKFVGNLRYATPRIIIPTTQQTTSQQTKFLKVEIDINDRTQNFYAKQIAMQIKKEMEYESHGTGGG